MPVYTLHCAHCERTFQGFVFEGSQKPETWICSACGNEAEPVREHEQKHPLEANHPSGCPCCGG